MGDNNDSDGAWLAALVIIVPMVIYFFARANMPDPCPVDQPVTVAKTWMESTGSATGIKYYARDTEWATYRLQFPELYSQVIEGETYTFAVDRCLGVHETHLLVTGVKEATP